MLGFAVLGGFVRVAAGAVLGGHDGSDGHLVFGLAPGQVGPAVILVMVLGQVAVAGLDQVAVQAGNVGVGVAAVGPVGKDPRGRGPVALDAGLGFRRHAALDAVLLDDGEIGLLLILLGQGPGGGQGNGQ